MVTDNARLLLGYIAGLLSFTDHHDYCVVSADPSTGEQEIEHRSTGTRFRVSVVQISGDEFTSRGTVE